MEKKSFVRGWILVVYGFIAFLLLTYFDVLSPNVFVSALAESKGFNSASMLMSSSIGNIAGAILGVVLGKRIEKKGAKNILIISALIAGVNFILIGAATTQAWACFHIFLNNTISLGYCLLPIVSLVSKWFPRKKGVILGVVTAGNVGSSTVLMTVAGKLAASNGIFVSQAVVGAIMIIWAIVGIFAIVETPQEIGLMPDNIPWTAEDEAAEMARKNFVSPWTFKEILSNGPVMMIIIAAGLITIGNIGAQVQGVNIMMEQGLGIGVAATIMGLTGIAAFIGSILSGILDQKTNSYIATIVLYVIAVVSFVLLIFGHGIIAGAGLFLVAAVTGAVNNLLPSHLMTRCGAENFDALWTVGSPLTRAMSCCGALFMSFSLMVSGGYHMGVIIEGVITVIGLVLVFLSGTTTHIYTRTEKMAGKAE